MGGDIAVRLVKDIGDRANIRNVVVAAVSAGVAMFPNTGRHYPEDIDDKEVFGAYVDGEGVGLLILRYHFGQTGEICWIGVNPRHQHKGIGKALLEKALTQMSVHGCKYAVASITNESGGTAPDLTHNLYIDNGFKPFLKFHEKDLDFPTMWMIRDL